MKKIYLSPSTKNINLHSESALMTMSDPTDPNLGVHEEEKSDAWTQKQSGSNSLWDTWSN